MALAHCSHCGTSFTPDNGVSVDDCPVCGRSVDCGSATMDSRKPLTAGEIEEIETLVGNHYATWESDDKEAAATYLARLLSILTPPTDAAVRLFGEFSVTNRAAFPEAFEGEVGR